MLKDITNGKRTMMESIYAICYLDYNVMAFNEAKQKQSVIGVNNT